MATVSTALLVVAACDKPPSASDLEVWQSRDHDRVEEANRIASGQSTTAQKSDDNRALIDVTWRQQCAQCHGNSGKGDGPMGPMVKANDLTRDDFQKRVSDADIATVIKNGRGKMPSFASLPDQAVTGLVAKVRSLRGQ